MQIRIFFSLASLERAGKTPDTQMSNPLKVLSRSTDPKGELK